MMRAFACWGGAHNLVWRHVPRNTANLVKLSWCEMHLMRGDNMASCAVAEGKIWVLSAPGGV
ncbi:hypothetical protein BKM88_01200 [Anaplasma marginale]|nr:hypothetical protein CQZ76_01210 [Anaplasma marginale]AXW84789.1 hypothetical protein BKM88_01200 [Anaplasma marginale]